MAKKFEIYDWMMKDMGLSGNELVAFAYLYGATKKGTEVFTGGYVELSSVMNTTIPTAYNTIKKLRDRQLVEPDGGMDRLTLKIA